MVVDAGCPQLEGPDFGPLVGHEAGAMTCSVSVISHGGRHRCILPATETLHSRVVPYPTIGAGWGVVTMFQSTSGFVFSGETPVEMTFPVGRVTTVGQSL